MAGPRLVLSVITEDVYLILLPPPPLPPGGLDWQGRPFVLGPDCSTSYYSLCDSLIQDTDASNFGLGSVQSQIQDDVECVVAYCSRALRPSQRHYCTTKREMLAAVSMCIQFRSYTYVAPSSHIYIYIYIYI